MAQITKEYSDALFSLGLEENCNKEFFEGLNFVQTVFNDNPEYIEFLACPSIPVEKRTRKLTEAFEGNVPEKIVNFLCILCKKGRINEFGGIREQYEKLYFASYAIVKAKVTSAVELTENEKNALKEKLEKMCGKSVILTLCADKTLMGGLVVDIDGKVIDGSVKHRLNHLKEVMHQ